VPSAAGGSAAVASSAGRGRRVDSHWMGKERLGLDLACVGPRPSIMQRTTAIRSQVTPSRLCLVTVRSKSYGYHWNLAF
jgi:hypothetical protein